MNAETTPIPFPALLLLGPTGSGKSPLGTELERRGYGSCRCHHFDFGEQLRRLAESTNCREPFSKEDVAIVRQALEKGLLLENEQFSIAEKLLRRFLRPKSLNDPNEWLVVMNGLPRHVGQALDVASWVNIQRVIYLRCDAETAFARIGRDIGGDRDEREDDQWELIQRRVARFERRTVPLLSFYRDQGARIDAVDVTVSMTPREAWEAVCRLRKAT